MRVRVVCVLWHLFLKFLVCVPLFLVRARRREAKRRSHTLRARRRRPRRNAFDLMREIIFKITRAEALKICAHSRVEGIFGSSLSSALLVEKEENIFTKIRARARVKPLPLC